MSNDDLTEWIQALNATTSNPNKKLDALFKQIQSSTTPSEILCYQNEIITILSRNISKKSSCNPAIRDFSKNHNKSFVSSAQTPTNFDLDSDFCEKVQNLIVGNDSQISLDNFELIENTSSFECSFQTATQMKSMEDKQAVEKISKVYNSNSTSSKVQPKDYAMEHEALRNVDAKMIENIINEVILSCTNIEWDQISGLEHAKSIIKEIVIWPMLRPDIFNGLRGPPRGLLLFGPPGTGKTLIGRCIASQAGATFFSISASSLTSKWVGEGEKMVRALFAVARWKQPSVIFIDEIDSILTQRSDSENESSRRIKTEFLVQFDGVGYGDSPDRLLVIGATNRPQELDEAARRRLVKRLYIPLPNEDARKHLVLNLLKSHNHSLLDADLDVIVSKSNGYSGSDLHALCREAVMQPLRTVSDIRNIKVEQVRPVGLEDFILAFSQIRPSVSDKDLLFYDQWNQQYGCL